MIGLDENKKNNPIFSEQKIDGKVISITINNNYHYYRSEKKESPYNKALNEIIVIVFKIGIVVVGILVVITNPQLKSYYEDFIRILKAL